MIRKINLMLMLILIFTLFVGCTEKIELPEGFKNKEFYKDMIYILNTVKTDLENKKLTHSLTYDIAVNDKFLKKIDSYKNLTKTEEKAYNLAYEVLDSLTSYIEINYEIYGQNEFNDDGTINFDLMFGEELYNNIIKFAKVLQIPIENQIKP